MSSVKDSDEVKEVLHSFNCNSQSLSLSSVHCRALHQAQLVGISLSFIPLLSSGNGLATFVVSEVLFVFVASLSRFPGEPTLFS